MMDELYGQLREVMFDVFDEDQPVTAETTAADFENWDSLGNIRLFMALEKRFGVRFSTGEITGLKNVGELVETLSGKIAASK